MQLTIGWLQLGRTYFILFVYIQNSGFAKTVKAFEVKLDRFWCEQELKYNYRATIATGPDPHNVENTREELVSQTNSLLPEWDFRC